VELEVRLQKVNFGDGSFTFDGVDNARKAAMESKPEGVDKHGEEIVGAVRELSEDRTY
jgi:cytochrome c oxidase subunit 2